MHLHMRSPLLARMLARCNASPFLAPSRCMANGAMVLKCWDSSHGRHLNSIPFNLSEYLCQAPAQAKSTSYKNICTLQCKPCLALLSCLTSGVVLPNVRPSLMARNAPRPISVCNKHQLVSCDIDGGYHVQYSLL